MRLLAQLNGLLTEEDNRAYRPGENTSIISRIRVEQRQIPALLE